MTVVRPPRLLAIVDAATCLASGVDPMGVLAAAGEAGASAVLVRAKTLTGEAWEEFAAEALRFARYGGSVALLSGDPADAARLGYDGVHLPGAAIDQIGVAKELGLLVGLSAHSVAEALRASKDGADYVTASPVWPTPSKPGYGPALGVDGLAAICRSVSLPVLALGGVTPDRVADAVGAGAYGVATMGPVCRKGGSAAVGAFMQALRRAV